MADIICKQSLANSSLSLYRMTKRFWSPEPDNNRHQLSRDCKSKLVSKRSVNNGSRPALKRTMREMSNCILRRPAQQIQEPSKMKSIKVHNFCSFNIVTRLVCKWGKPTRHLFPGWQGSKPILRWGKKWDWKGLFSMSFKINFCDLYILNYTVQLCFPWFK